MDLELIEPVGWDAIVIGSGFGGGAVAFSLTRRGYRVLLVEKGRSDAVHRALLPAAESPEHKLAEGRWPTKIPISIDGNKSETWPVIGCGLGGSSIHYGATLGRFRPGDFEVCTRPDGQTVNWPYDYQELEPYYLEAEALLNVCGTSDPLENDTNDALLDPPEMSESDTHLFRAMNHAGLHPFRLHVGLRQSANCQWCASGPCSMACKSDVRNTFIEPAQNTGHLTVLDQTEAVELLHDEQQVTGVKLRQGSTTREMTAHTVVLAAGALFSPVLLMKSASEIFPQGLGNNHDQVGRNLMFHAGDLLAIWPEGKYSREGMNKSIALRDFYQTGEQKLGEIQSMGLTAGYHDILNYLHALFARSILRGFPILRHAARIPAYIAAKLLKEASVMSALVEDYPYPDNRVKLDADSPSGMSVEYHLREELVVRVKKQRQLIREALYTHKLAVLNPGIELNYGHPCGTCRAGEDPLTSVVDKDCRVHGMQNLYVADASFMPSSGGTNPSLTIAANALRVADKIAARLAT